MKSFFRMSYPYILWIAIFIVAPMILILLYAVTRSGNSTLTFRFTKEEYGVGPQMLDELQKVVDFLSLNLPNRRAA